MLPIYSAISFQYLMPGGRNNPWLILANENGSERPYVLKPFPSIVNDRSESIAKEVIGNILAKEFGLRVPKAALIDTDDMLFQNTINDMDAFHAFEYADERIKFATEYIAPSQQFIQGAFSKRKIQKAIEIDSLFAFDNLIRNNDRGAIRPNLLMKDTSAILIDHELAFDINDQTFPNMMNKVWDMRYRSHIFYGYLQKSRKANKKDYFIEFHEYLRTLSVNALYPFINQLNREGYQTAKMDANLQYLDAVRINSSSFVNLLQGII